MSVLNAIYTNLIVLHNDNRVLIGDIRHAEVNQ